jgi:hypothetical protein
MNSITLKGQTITLSEQLIKSQSLSTEDVATILGLHARKLALYEELETAEDFSLEALGRELREVEYALQRAWKFPQSAKYHRFWEAPRCACPKMDNAERYPSDLAIVNGNCPLHGEIGYE